MVAETNVLIAGGQEQSLDVRMEIAVHPRHLEFVFEVRHRPQAPQDHPRLLPADEFHEQAAEALDSDVAIGLEHLARKAQAFLQREEGVFPMAVRDANHDFVEERGGAPHEVLVAPRDRIKRSRIHRLDHRVSFPEDENAPCPRGRSSE